MIAKSAAFLSLSLVLAIPADGGVTASDHDMIRLPSGAQAYLQEVLIDRFGDTGLTYRYRYVMPDLALRVPATQGPASDIGPQDIDTQAWEDGDFEGDYIDDGMIALEDFDFAPMISLPGAEEAADDIIDRTLSDQPGSGEIVLPPAPPSTFKDPIHDDVFWLCAHHALPDVLGQPTRPTQIIISIADQESPFGAYDPEILQLFEAFSLPKDQNQCDWRPW